MTTTRSLFDSSILRQATIDSFVKLNPRHMIRNPVMFVVEIGSVLVTFLFIRDFSSSSTSENVFAGLVAAWLWFTVLFANLAEAMAEGRGKGPSRDVAQGAHRDHGEPAWCRRGARAGPVVVARTG